MMKPRLELSLPTYLVEHVIDRALWNLSKDDRAGCDIGGSAYHRKIIAEAVVEALCEAGGWSS